MTAAVATLPPPVGARTLELRGLRLNSAFQPIVSLSHRRVVGHEALLRATDAQGHAVPPLQALALATGAAAEARLDTDCLQLHVANFGRQAQGAQWLFANLRPGTFLRGAREAVIAQLSTALHEHGLTPQQLVLEVTEDAVADPSAFESAGQAAREAGCLLALDDFGAGHSNFDRVWRIRPDIVKLDRSLVQRGALDGGVARVIAQMVSLLHQCGALVLMEGIETADEANVALDCDVDLVQGYRFGRPMPQLQGTERLSRPLVSAWSQFERRAGDSSRAHRERIAPYLNAIGHGGSLIEAGRSVAAAAGPRPRARCR
ncbi:EAL domain-containing protein [Aquincola sp. S2]|uniref:EAL domain-containing protein n=1 Tax=Pseudaquabacterium terrae TaxID=2732868 RepID=A0ABX2EJJ4_9BURK|nr:EAL domain-containing protein [Aquabacterium terrae]NRF68835.1 EAL domain-containing protein [Aquabacterium terrae]